LQCLTYKSISTMSKLFNMYFVQFTVECWVIQFLAFDKIKKFGQRYYLRSIIANEVKHDICIINRFPHLKTHRNKLNRNELWIRHCVGSLPLSISMDICFYNHNCSSLFGFNDVMIIIIIKKYIGSIQLNG